MDDEPAALHGEASMRVTPDPRPMHIEETIMRQIDRIGYLRSTGQAWDEALFQLRDQVVGLEDDEFWSGIPKTLDRKKLKPEEVAAYARRGWHGIEFQVKIEMDRMGRQRETLDPTKSELSLAFRVIMALFARRGMTWRRQSEDEVPVLRATEEEATS